MLQTLERSILPVRLQTEGLSIATCLAAELPDTHVEQLVKKSLQPHIMEFEGGEDVYGEPFRFRSLKDYRAWAEGKTRFLNLMINEALNPDDLGVPDIGGVIWFGERASEYAPGSKLTFAIRHYAEEKTHGWDQYQGRGLGSPFMQVAHNNLREWYQDESIWLDLVHGNEAAHNLYLRNGYVDLLDHNDPHHGGQRRIVMANDTALMTRAA